MISKYKQRKDGRFFTSVTIGKKADGSPIVKFVYGKSSKEVSNKVSAIRNEGIIEKNNFKRIADEWATAKEATVGYNTYIGYKENMNKLEPLFDLPIEDISVSNIQRIVNNLHLKGYSKSVIGKVKKVYGMIADYAIAKNIKITNYSKLINIPTNAKETKREAISEEEINLIKNNVDKPFGLYAYILLYTGLRRGELLALQWKDVDLQNKTIYINKSIEFIGNNPNIKKPKTAAGIRVVPILDNLYFHLNKHSKSNSFFVFGGDSPLAHNQINDKWNKYIEMINDNGKKHTDYHFTQHQLRHTFITIMYKAGIDVKTAQIIAGHANIKTMLDIYTHMKNEEIDKSDFDKLNKYVNPSE